MVNDCKEPRFTGIASERSSMKMSRIKGKDTSIELALRKILWKNGYRYRKNYKDLPGRPDIALTKYKIAIFCDSEFFHGKDWDVLRPRLEKKVKTQIIGLGRLRGTWSEMLRRISDC